MHVVEQCTPSQESHASIPARDKIGGAAYD